jgi:ribosomal protein S13
MVSEIRLNSGRISRFAKMRRTCMALAGEDELRFFEMLLTVSGIGPRSALAVLDTVSIETLRSAISQNRAEYLTKVSGIGKKTAEKIVLELKDKIGAFAENASLKGDEEALEALRARSDTHRVKRERLSAKSPRNFPMQTTDCAKRSSFSARDHELFEKHLSFLSRLHRRTSIRFSFQ